MLRELRERCAERERGEGEACLNLPASSRSAARNLLHATAMDEAETGELDALCARLGVRTPTLAPGGVLAAIDAASRACAAIAGEPDVPGEPPEAGDETEGASARARAAGALLGASPGRVRIVATLPPAADEAGVRAMGEGGMDVARLNTARVDPARWVAAAAMLRRARPSCRLLVTLPGPRLRTGAIEPGARVVRVRPERDAMGQVVEPGRVRLVAEESAGEGDVPLPAPFLASLRHGDKLRMLDARGRERTLVIIGEGDARGGRLALCARTAYITGGLPVSLEHPAGRAPEARIGAVEPVAQTLTLRVGDRLFLTRSQSPGRPATGAHPARLACTLPGVLDDLGVGSRVVLDEGRIEATVARVNDAGAEVEVVRTRRAVERLGGDRPIHLPGVRMSVPLLSERDERALAFAAAHADAVGVSFCRDAADLDLIESRLRSHLPAGRAMPGVVLTVETEGMAQALDGLLLRALGWSGCGVLLSRGELSVETGSARLPRVESRVVRLAQAARVALLYSTPALRSLVRRGRPGRSEPGDQGALLAADAAVLGTGERIGEAVRWLDGHLRASIVSG